MSMTETFNLDPEIAGNLAIAAEGLIKLPLDKEGNLTTDTPFARVVLRIEPNGIHLERIESELGTTFSVQYLGGPIEGVVESEVPAIFGSAEAHFLLDASGNRTGPDETVRKLAIYARCRDGERVVYRFSRMEESVSAIADSKAQVLHQWAVDLMNRFYKKPDYSIYSTPQPPEHEQIDISLGDRHASVDRGVSDIILGLWMLDLDTLGSCQQRSSGKAYVHLPVPGHAEIFRALLDQNGIPFEFKPKTMTIKKAGQEYPVIGASILFDPDVIPRILKALHKTRAQSESRILESISSHVEYAMG